MVVFRGDLLVYDGEILVDVDADVVLILLVVVVVVVVAELLRSCCCCPCCYIVVTLGLVVLYSLKRKVMFS